MKTALLFSGQGSQTVGMGRDLCEKYEVCRKLFTHANEVLGRDIQKICFEGPVDVLTKTDNAQPAIFLTSLACFEALKSQVPDLAFDATAGGMASILNMDDAALAEVCEAAEVDIANINCPGQVVISGDKDKIAKAIELAKEKGAKRAIPLVVAGAYHSRLMEGAKVKVADALGGLRMQLPKVPVVSNVTARPAGGIAEIKELLVRQVTSPVRWSESMQWLVAEGFTRFIELGPGNVLSGLMKRINKDVEMLSVSDVPTLDATVTKLKS